MLIVQWTALCATRKPYASYCVENDGHSMADQVWTAGFLGGLDGSQPFGPAPTRRYESAQGPFRILDQS